MVHLFLIGLGAGAATALLFASVSSGSALAIPLFYLSPLPILIAAMGWSHWAGLIAAIVASASLAAAFGPYLFIAFLLGVGLPAWWLGYLALLARPVATAPDGLEWYPVGHLIVWAAVLSGLIVIAEVAHIGTTEESFRAATRSGIERALRAEGDATGETNQVLSRQVLDLLVTYMPMVAGILTTLTAVMSVALAARIVKVSGRLRRPWPQLSAMTFPTYAPVLTAVAVAGFFLPDMPGIASGVMMASMLTAYAILGFAVLHAITRGTRGRPFALGSAYAAVLLIGWPALALIALGLADGVFDLRGIAARRRGPPNLPDPRT
jgi:Predicted membrane protein (DUF2232)